MDVLFFAHLLNGLLMLAMPIGLAIYLTSRWNLGGRIWWIGAATFLLSQVAHIPFNWGIGKILNQTGMVAWDPKFQLIFNAVFLGLSAGVFEEGARYLVMRWWATKVRSWRKGVLFGAGHGGAEAIFLGILVLYGFLQFAALRNADLAKVFPASQLDLAQRQVEAYWSASWYASLLGAMERFLAIPCQIAMAVMVLQGFIRKHIRWLFLAIAYHAIIDALAVVGLKYFGAYWTEVSTAGFAILSVILIFALRTPEPPPDIIPVTLAMVRAMPVPLEETPENLEKTRYL